MIKRKGQQHREGVTPPSLKRMSDTEHAAYFEAFGAIKGDYQALCLIGDKLREVEASAPGLGSLDSQAQSGHAVARLGWRSKSVGSLRFVDEAEQQRSYPLQAS